MILKKPAAQKRADFPRSPDYTKTFRKDWERLSHSGRYDMHRLKEAMLLLIANDGPLAPEYKDHALSGDWEDFRECHVGGFSACLPTVWCVARNLCAGRHAFGIVWPVTRRRAMP